MSVSVLERLDKIEDELKSLRHQTEFLLKIPLVMAVGFSDLTKEQKDAFSKIIYSASLEELHMAIELLLKRRLEKRR